jgi:hypothetical protein
MSKLETDITKVQESCAIVIYDGTNIAEGPWKAYLVLKGINGKPVTFLDGGLGDGNAGGMQFHVAGEPAPVTIPFLGQTPITRNKHWNLKGKNVVSNLL